MGKVDKSKSKNNKRRKKEVWSGWKPPQIGIELDWPQTEEELKSVIWMGGKDDNSDLVKTGRKTTRNDYPYIKPLPENRRKANLHLSYTKEEYERMRLGFMPGVNDDRWIIFEENDVFYFHRFVTGNCIFTIRFEEQNGSYHSVETWVSMEEGPRDDDRSLIELVNVVINERLLGRKYVDLYE